MKDLVEIMKTKAFTIMVGTICIVFVLSRIKIMALEIRGWKAKPLDNEDK